MSEDFGETLRGLAQRAGYTDVAAVPSDGGFLITPVIDVDVSGPVRRFFVRVGLAKPKIERRDFLSDVRAALENLDVRGLVLPFNSPGASLPRGAAKEGERAE